MYVVICPNFICSPQLFNLTKINIHERKIRKSFFYIYTIAKGCLYTSKYFPRRQFVYHLTSIQTLSQFLLMPPMYTMHMHIILRL